MQIHRGSIEEVGRRQHPQPSAGETDEQEHAGYGNLGKNGRAEEHEPCQNDKNIVDEQATKSGDANKQAKHNEAEGDAGSCPDHGLLIPL